jgi:syntaxin-binding protein 1
VYEVTEAHNRDVFIGSTEILRPQQFIEHLTHLRGPVPLPANIIPPYVPPSPKRQSDSVSMTASLMSHMHINSSNSHLSSKSSSLSMSPSSEKIGAAYEEGKEKKKKKGLKKFFG